MNPQDCVWGNSIPHHHEDHIAGNDKIHYSTTIWFTSLFLRLKPSRFEQQKQQWENFEKSSAWNLTKVTSKKEVIFAASTDICHLKSAELDKTPKNQKFYSEVIL